MTLDELKQEFQKLVLGESYEREFKQYLKNKYAQSTIDVYYIPTLGGIFNQIFDEDIFKIQSSDLDFLNKCLDEFHQGCLNKYNVNGGAPRNCLRQYIAYLKKQIIPSKFTDIEKEKFLEIIQEFLDKVDELRSTGKTTGSMPTQFEKSMNEVLQNLDYVCNFSFGQGILSSVPFINFCPKNILNKDLVNGDKLSGRRGIYIGFGYDYNKQKLDLVIGYGNNDTQECEAKNEIDKYRPNEWEYTYKRDEFEKIKDQIVKDFLNLVSEFNQIPIEYFKPKGAEVIQQTNKSANETNGVPPLNQILYGPPGTGKTYNTINKALEILGVETQGKSRAELKAKFDEFRQNGQIEFVTFHQSFSYEEFVEGIKPKFINSNESAESSKMEYEIKSGIFKQICDRAKQYTKEFVIDQQVVKPYVLDKNKTLWRLYTLPDAKIDNDFFDECIKNGCVKAYYDYGGVTLSEKAQNGDYVVIPSTNYGEMSKTIRAFGILRDNDNKQTKENKIYYKNVDWLWVAKDENEIIRFDKVNFNRPTFQRVKQGKESIIDYMDILLDKNKESFTTKPCILIIDEINRGNISKILGELITLIEPSKRIGASDEEKARSIGNESLEVTLPYSNESFGVPSNLYIIGTMNTADRSIALLDTALRRRFEFVEMMPEPELLKNIWIVKDTEQRDNENQVIPENRIEELDKYMSEKSNCLYEILNSINNRIEFLLDREHTIGHAFFFEKAKFYKNDKLEWYELTLESLKEIFVKKIIPLLQEYFYDDYAKIDAVLNGNGMVKDFSKNDLQVNLSDDFVDSDKKIYCITKSSKWNEKNFLRICDASVQIDKDE